MSSDRALSAKEWGKKSFWPFQPKCAGYEGGCDGDLPGEEHIKECPMFGKQPVSMWEFAEAYGAYRATLTAQPDATAPACMKCEQTPETAFHEVQLCNDCFSHLLLAAPAALPAQVSEEQVRSLQAKRFLPGDPCVLVDVEDVLALMDIESVVKQVPHTEFTKFEMRNGVPGSAILHGPSYHPEPHKKCARCQLESYAASQREMRKGLVGLEKLLRSSTHPNEQVREQLGHAAGLLSAILEGKV